jgi:Aldo/keto reductase family
MATLTLGETQVARIGLGTNRLRNTPENVAFVRDAVAAGIGLIDTAHTYTGGESEQTIGAALYPTGLRGVAEGSRVWRGSFVAEAVVSPGRSRRDHWRPNAAFLRPPRPFGETGNQPLEPACQFDGPPGAREAVERARACWESPHPAGQPVARKPTRVASNGRPSGRYPSLDVTWRVAVGW